MLDNTITLDVDVDGTGTNNETVVFTRKDEVSGRSYYESDSHANALRDILQFYRTKAKRSGNYMGSDKAAAKFTHDVTVNGVDQTTSIVSPAIIEVSTSLPVGMTDADIEAFFARMPATINLRSLFLRLVKGEY